MKFSKTEANITTEPIDVGKLGGNTYELINILGKRARQINEELFEELSEKLESFKVHNEGLEEIFENLECVELSRLYEKLPKPHAIALQEFLNGKLEVLDRSSEQ